MTTLGDQIRLLKSQGTGPTAIAEQLGCSISSFYYHTNDDRRRRNIDRLIDLRKDNKERGVELLGGKCQKCDYDRCLDALVFHHREPHEKESRIGGTPMTWTKFRAEIEKCVLLCCLCHTELHAGIWTEEELASLDLVYHPNGVNTGRLVLPPSKRKRA